jgi:predicted RNA-binding protein with PIN domain
VPDPTLYLFDGFNVLHAGGFSDARELRDALASFVALHGARGIVVFDGVGEDGVFGPLEVRYAENADAALERLAAEHRHREEVVLVSSDLTVRGTAGKDVTKRASQIFVSELEDAGRNEEPRTPLASQLDAETQAKLERLRRGE